MTRDDVSRRARAVGLPLSDAEAEELARRIAIVSDRMAVVRELVADFVQTETEPPELTAQRSRSGRR